MPRAEQLAEEPAADAAAPDSFPVEMVAVGALKDHPHNYRTHPDDQIEHLCASIREHGLYRNIVVARDHTILAGHGVVLAVRKMGWAVVPVVRRDLDPLEASALKLLAADNEIAHLAEVEDRKLTEMLKLIRDSDAGLLGTGFDEMMLANLLYVTRSESEIATRDEAAHWVGMPEYDEGVRPPQLLISFADEAAKTAFLAQIAVRNYRGRGSRVWTCWYPDREQDDTSSLRFEDSA
jgi:hypothetical protein